MSNRIFNFSAGPATLPESVLKKAQSELLDFNGNGMSVMEMSHRSKAFEAVNDHAEAKVREHYSISDEYAVLFLQGGATLQFSMVPMNLYQKGKPVDFIHTGAWTKKALGELQKIGDIRMAANSGHTNFDRVPDLADIKLSADASYVYLCSNNTIFGTQFQAFPDTGDVPLVADMSSDILSRPIDINQFGLIFAGAQKNIGPAGTTLVIIRKDLADRADADRLPSMLTYSNHIGAHSLFNTAPTFGIYMIGLVLDWITENGGLDGIARANEDKAQKLYQFIDESDFYMNPVQKESRSRMNVVFRLSSKDETLEKECYQQAEKQGLSGLKGHRSVGGLRASIYNAMPAKGVDALITFLKEFEQQNSSKKVAMNEGNTAS